VELGKVATASLAAEKGGAATSVDEEVLALGNVLHVDLSAAIGFGKDTVGIISKLIPNMTAENEVSCLTWPESTVAGSTAD
jgi:hypothetical protein